MYDTTTTEYYVKMLSIQPNQNVGGITRLHLN